MPEGPLGGPRPFANVPDHLAVFTATLDSSSRVAIRKPISDDLDIQNRDSIRVLIYPLTDHQLDLRDNAGDIRRVVGNTQMVIDKRLRELLGIGPGDRVMVLIIEVVRVER